MRLDCPQCGTGLEYSRVAPRFCSHCGTALGSEAPTLAPRRPAEASTLPGGGAHDPEATHAYTAPRRPGGHPEAIGRYRLLRTLGGGGMGTVFEAEEEVTTRRVALKLIRPEFTDSPDAVERFRREGRLASALFHPRCVFVLAADEEAGQPYIVMELMPGKNLSDLVAEKGPLPVEEAVTKVLDVVEGLQEAHRLGVVHRDVKPSNCFLDEDGRVKVGDFGLAKSLVGPEQLTRSGSFLGTVLFASPEQIRNEPVDPQTDVYSVCATLYYLLTGRAPFQDDDPTAALARAVSDPPPSMRKYRKDVPRTLDEVVLRGLAKSRRTRWQDLEELRLALLPFLGGPAIVPEVGWRVTAFLLDLLLLLPLGLVVGKLVALLAPASQERAWPLLSPLLGLVCGVVYFGLPEWLVGCSPGKFATRLRVRDVRTNDRPSLPRALWRTFLFYLVLDAGAIVAGVVLVAVGGQVGGWLAEERDVGVALRVVASVVLVALLPYLTYGVGLAVLASTMRRRNGYLGLHELLSGTRVIRLPGQGRRFRAQAKAGWPAKVPQPDGVPGRVGSYEVHALARRTADEMVLQGEDAALHRPVWLWLRRGGPELTAARRDAARDARPRWLAGGEQDGWRWDAFVAAPGGVLADHLVPKRRRLGWREALGVLEQLAAELEEAEREGTLPDRLSPEQVWVQASGRVMLLDAPAREPTLVRTPMNLLRQAAAVALEGQPRPHGDLGRPIRAPIPWHASELMGRLVGASGAEEPFASLPQAREALAKAHELPEEISRPGRGLQVGVMLAGMAPGLLCLFGLGPVVLLVAYIVCVLGAATGDFAREQVEACLAETDEEATPELAREYREQLAEIDRERAAVVRDREVVLASWSWFVVGRLKDFEDRFRREYSKRLESYLGVEDDEAEGLDYFLAKADDLTAGPSGLVAEWRADWVLPAILLGWPLVWAAWSFATRGGLAPRLAGIALVGADGRPAARWRCAWRTLLVWLPVALVLLAALYLDLWRVASSRDGWGPDEVRFAGWLAWHLWWSALGLVGVYIFAAIVWPNRGPHDRLSGVYPVPR